MSEFTPLSPEELLYDWPPELDHFSASSAKMAVRCEEQWRQRYILGSVQPPSLGLIAGRADHAAIEKSMKQKIDSFVDLPVGDVREAFLDRIETDIAYYGGIGEVEVPRAETKGQKLKVLDKLRVEGQTFVANYHTQISPGLQPTSVEDQFSLTVAGLPVPVIGFVDLIAHDTQGSLLPAEETLRIIDRKRSIRPKRKPEPEWSIQAEIYQLAYPLRHDWHVTNSTNGTIDTSLSQELPDPTRSTMQVQHIFSKIGWLYMKYGPDNPWPVTGKLHPWACNYCGFRPSCWGWK